jgi:hypothetical protein
MKFMFQCRVPNDTANKAIMDGSLFTRLQEYIDRSHAEAVYYSVGDGQRTVFFVVNFDQPEKWPFFLEPMWHDLKADITVWPVFTSEDMQRAAPDIEELVQSRKAQQASHRSYP